MSELPDGIEPAPIPEPKDSALGIVVRRRGDGAFDVLLGRRSRRSRFMPGNLAFPGGKLEDQDQPGREGSFERCASRELLEETGLAIPAAAWSAAGERTTPPIFPVRFRTLFFVAELPEGASLPASPPSPEELETLDFADPNAVLADWGSGRALVPPPLLPILRSITRPGPRDAVSLASAIARVNDEESACPRIEFTPGIWVFPVRSRTLPPASCTNVWMPGGRRFIVIDPGSDDPEEMARLLAVVAKRTASGSSVGAVVLTHQHRDHAQGAGPVAASLGVPVVAHAETLSRIPKLPAGVATRALGDGELLDLAGMTLTSLHTPGHAPGHLAFFDAEGRVLISGDLVSGLSTILVGSAEGDMDDYLASLRRVVALDPKTVLPSHGPPLPGGALAATIAHREAREARVLAVLADGTGRPLTSIAEAAYADAPEALPFLQELQTRAHLARLIRLGRVEKAGDTYRAIGIPGTSMLS
jgi:glyoxylase-like metal-dependent hydrolase (beta-lactamase superfamily II)/8-oxo-dGTP pyrophosphatase MutT (NUDIX family)